MKPVISSLGSMGVFVLVASTAPFAHAAITNYEVNSTVPGAGIQTNGSTANIKIDGLGVVNTDAIDTMVNIQTPGVVVKTTAGTDVKLGFGGQSLSMVVETGVDASSAKTIMSLEGNAATYIRTQDDADAYGTVVVENTPQVKSVKTNSNNVHVTYTQTGKLFGFIPVNMKAAVNVDAAGTVSVKLPWYKMLVVRDDSVASSVKAIITTAKTENKVLVSGEATIEPVDQARLTQYVTQVLVTDSSVAVNVK
ncbi:MAG: hypothetical protein AB202_02890 [Parcubacteria bacterium C7867-007]|nr:MAG: hypothetical protein AB202_02890 [Parcubacteria bacterium C7867-007]